MKITARNDVVFVKLEPRQTATAGGLHIPEVARRMGDYGTVIAVGPGKLAADGTRVPTGIKVGDRVYLDYYKKHREETVLPDGTEAIIFRAHEIHGVVE